MKLNIDDMSSNENKNCYMCGIELNKTNISTWEVFTKNNTTSRQCLFCHEAGNRMLDSAKKVGNELVPTKSRSECLGEMKKEGLTMEILKAIEERDFESNIM